MTKVQRRKAVAIATDVLEQMKEGNLAVTTGRYFESSFLNGVAYQFAGKSLQKVLPDLGKCTVCALGACFYSHIVLHNRYKINDMDRGGDYIGITGHNIMAELGRVFSQQQLNEIESAFECGEMTVDAKPKTVMGSVAFGCRYKRPGNRLKAIMNNIIANDGEFLP